MNHYPLLSCLCCNSPRLKLILDLQKQPPANLYLPQPSANLPHFPLRLNRCEDCWHAQLSWNVNRREIFDDYAYVSGTSKTLNQFFAWFANALRHVVGNKENKRVLEIAANDGSLIRELQLQGFSCIGIDPAKNIVEKAQQQGLPLEVGYWPAAETQIHGKFDVIIGMNVLAHVDNPLSFLNACSKKLAPGGFIIIQPSQARMIENGEFDTIYHEHISFFNSRSIGHLAARAGLKLVGTALVRVHGDSPIYILQHINETSQPISYEAFTEGDFGIAEDLLAYELRVKLFEDNTYINFAAAATQVIEKVKAVVSEYRMAGFQIAFVGSAAKAITLLNATQIKPDYLLDESPFKIGLYAPGCNTVVSPLTVTANWDIPTLFILSAWNFRYELANKLTSIGVPNGSKFYAYFPQSHWITV